MGIKTGKNCNIHPSVVFFGDDITMGDNIRIDAFSVITGHIEIGNNVHIGCFNFLSGGDGIKIKDFVGISPRASLFSASDDYSGQSMSNPTIPDQFKGNITRGEIVIGKHVLIGSNVTVLPKVVIGDGCSIGAFTLVNKSLEEWKIYAGIPAKVFKDRSKNLLELEKEYLKWQQQQQ